MESSTRTVGVMLVTAIIVVGLFFFVTLKKGDNPQLELLAAKPLIITVYGAVEILKEEIDLTPHPLLAGRSLCELLSNGFLEREKDPNKRRLILRRDGESDEGYCDRVRDELYNIFANQFIPVFLVNDTQNNERPMGVFEFLYPQARENMNEEYVTEKIGEYLVNKKRLVPGYVFQGYNYKEPKKTISVGDALAQSLIQPLSTSNPTLLGESDILIAGQAKGAPIVSMVDIDQLDRDSIPTPPFFYRRTRSSMGTVIRVYRDPSDRPGVCRALFIAPTTQVASLLSNKPKPRIMIIPGAGLISDFIDNVSEETLKELDDFFKRTKEDPTNPTPPPPSLDLPPIVPPPSDLTTPPPPSGDVLPGSSLEPPPSSFELIPPSPESIEGSPPPPSLGLSGSGTSRILGRIFAFFQSPPPPPNPPEPVLRVFTVWFDLLGGGPVDNLYYQFKNLINSSGKRFACLDKKTRARPNRLSGQGVGLAGRIIKQIEPGVVVDTGLSLMVERVDCDQSPRPILLSIHEPQVGDAVTLPVVNQREGNVYERPLQATIIRKNNTSKLEIPEYLIDLEPFIHQKLRELGIDITNMTPEERKRKKEEMLYSQGAGSEFPTGILPGTRVTIIENGEPRILGFYATFKEINGQYFGIITPANALQGSIVNNPQAPKDKQFTPLFKPKSEPLFVPPNN